MESKSRMAYFLQIDWFTFLVTERNNMENTQVKVCFENQDEYNELVKEFDIKSKEILEVFEKIKLFEPKLKVIDNGKEI